MDSSRSLPMNLSNAPKTTGSEPRHLQVRLGDPPPPIKNAPSANHGRRGVFLRFK